MLKLSGDLLTFSADNAGSARVMEQNLQKVEKWSKEFRTEGITRINTLVTGMAEELRKDIWDFAEDHYEDSQAGEKWGRHVKSAGIQQKAEKFVHELSRTCGDRLKEFSGEIKNELDLVSAFSAERAIRMEEIMDTKRWWNWGTFTVSGVLMVFALFAPVSWVVGAAAGLLGWIGSFFFDKRETKARRARGRLADKLNEQIDKMEIAMKKQLTDWFQTHLMEGRVREFRQMILGSLPPLKNLAKAQRDLAWTINQRILHLNRVLLEEGLKQADALDMASHVREIARDPGCAVMLLIAPGTVFPEEVKTMLTNLLGETVWFVIDNGFPPSILSQAIGRGIEKSSIIPDESLKTVRLPLDGIDTVTFTRVRLAQQLTGYHITK